MTDTPNLPIKAPLRSGGAVLAIIPQDIDQVWRIAGMAVMGRMAPKSLVDGKDPDEATSACAIAILAGAELGLSPMTALRSYAVINGRPALWGDGIKAVVRQSGLCEFIRTGSDQAKGWCEAKRSDTGETKRVEFTMEQAKRAGLATKTGPWKDGYADVMMERRATNRCLNDLFADVLGGLANVEEAIEDGPISNEPRDITPSRPTPPEPPADDEPDAATIISGTSNEVEKIKQVDGDDPDEDESPADFLTRLDEELALAGDEATLLEIWEREDAPTKLDGTPFAEDADKIYSRHEPRVAKKALEIAGQSTMFEDDSNPGDR